MTITWQTTKTEAGFEYKILGIVYGQSVQILKVGTKPTRSQAVGEAKRQCKITKAA